MPGMASSRTMIDGLVDSWGRNIDYVRVSVTDRCNLRCSYCMAERMSFVPRHDLLTLEELAELCRRLVGSVSLSRPWARCSAKASTN
jgi:predicted DNA-binding helix-hairpin-helix protein